MKPFNLEEALAGKPVVMRSGLPVTQLTLFQTSRGNFNLYGVADGAVFSFNKDGVYSSTLEETDRDLFMASEKKHGWINIYDFSGTDTPGGQIYQSKTDAVSDALYRGFDLLNTIKIEYEV